MDKSAVLEDDGKEAKRKEGNLNYERVRINTINPKSLTIG